MTKVKEGKVNYKHYLKNLVSAVNVSIKALDGEMKKPCTEERGRRISKIINFLDVAKDVARHFGLGEKL